MRTAEAPTFGRGAAIPMDQGHHVRDTFERVWHAYTTSVPRWAQTLINATVTLILVGGVLGGLALSAVQRVFSSHGPVISLPLWALILMLAIAGLLCAGATVLTWFERDSFWEPQLDARQDELDDQDDALELLDSIVRADDTLFRLLNQLVAQNATSTAMQQLMDEFLRDAMNPFDVEITRAAVYTPSVDRKRLELVASYHVNRSHFSLEPPALGGRRGSAVMAFIDPEQQVRVVQFSQNEERSWVASDAEYIDFRPTRHHAPYLSIANVPIVGVDDATLGVMCFTSMNVEVFDSDDAHELLLALGRRLGAVMTVYRQLSARNATPEPRT